MENLNIRKVIVKQLAYIGGKFLQYHSESDSLEKGIGKKDN